MSTKAKMYVNGGPLGVDLVETTPGSWLPAQPVILSSGDTLEITFEETGMTDSNQVREDDLAAYTGDAWNQDEVQPFGEDTPERQGAAGEVVLDVEVPEYPDAEPVRRAGREAQETDDALEVPRGDGIDVSRFDARPIMEAADREAEAYAASAVTQRDDSVEVVVWRDGQALTLSRAFDGAADTADLIRALGRLHDAAVDLIEQDPS